MDILTPDICVIGGGSGGLTVAAASAAMGASVVLVERDKMGGDCLNTGCVPSKSLIAASKRAHTIEHAGAFGVSTEGLKVNFGRINEHIKSVIADIEPHDSVERFEGLGVSVIKENGEFYDANTLKAGETLVRARRFVIATGSRAAIPPIEGLADTPHFTNETIFDQTRKPAHLVIIGAGPIGMEMAQAHRRLGSDVTIIDMNMPLANDDPELVAIVRQKLEAEGIRILANTGIAKVEEVGEDRVDVTLDDKGDGETIKGSHILVAAGRVPNAESLALDKANIAFDAQGIKTNKSMRTKNRKIFAVGDVAGRPHFTHAAGYQAGLVVRQSLFGLRAKQNLTLLPWVTYTDPELAHIGLNEQQAKKKYGNRFKIVRVPFANNDRARAERRTEGMLKMLFHRDGRILGATIVGLHAGEIINLISYAMANGGKAGNLTKFISPYPTLSEIVRRAGIEFYHDKLDNPWLRRLRLFVRRLP